MRLVGTLPLVLGLAACARPSREASFDLLITGATIVDGTGLAGSRGDVAVRGDRIARVSRRPLARAMARRVIEATGKVVAPGFIDMHAHLEPLLRLPGAENLVRQGVTTALGGPDGGGPLPLDVHLDSAAAAGLGI